MDLISQVNLRGEVGRVDLIGKVDLIGELVRVDLISKVGLATKSGSGAPTAAKSYDIVRRARNRNIGIDMAVSHLLLCLKSLLAKI